MSNELSHLHAIELRLSHERSRITQLKHLPVKPSRNAVKTKEQAEIEWREHNVRMIERERADEIKFLEKRGIVPVAEVGPLMSLDEIFAELEELLVEGA